MKVHVTDQHIFLEIPSSVHGSKWHQKIRYCEKDKKWYRAEPEQYSIAGAKEYVLPDEALYRAISNLINEGNLPHVINE